MAPPAQTPPTPTPAHPIGCDPVTPCCDHAEIPDTLYVTFGDTGTTRTLRWDGKEWVPEAK